MDTLTGGRQCVWPIRVTVSSTNTLTQGVGSVCMAIHGWTRDVSATESSTDTLTGGASSVCRGG